MNLAHAKDVVLEMTFGSRALYDHFIRDLGRNPSLMPNILRGRIAQDGASLRLELRGASRRIDALVERWKEFIVARSPAGVLAA